MTDTVEVRCIKCGSNVKLVQPDDHSEYRPAGMCPKCGAFHYVSFTTGGDMQVNAGKLTQA